MARRRSESGAAPPVPTSLRAIMRQAMNRERRAMHFVAIVTRKSADPLVTCLPVDTFYENVCNRIGAARVADLMVLTLDANAGYYMLCNALAHDANWMASALARRLVCGRVVLIRAYSWRADGMQDFVECDYGMLNEERRALRTKLEKRVSAPQSAKVCEPLDCIEPAPARLLRDVLWRAQREQRGRRKICEKRKQSA